MKRKLSALIFVCMLTLLCCIAPALAKDIVYDEVIFAPVKIATYEGRHFLDVEDMDGNIYSMSFENYGALKDKIALALKETDSPEKHLAFYMKLNDIVDVSSFYKETVYVYANYAETKEYFAITASFMDADAKLKLKVTKEDNPLSYKISDKFIEEHIESTVYFYNRELIGIEKIVYDN